MADITTLSDADQVAETIIRCLVVLAERKAARKVAEHDLKVAQEAEDAPVRNTINSLMPVLEQYVLTHPEQYPSKRVAGAGLYGLRKFPDVLVLDADFDALEAANVTGLSDIAVPVEPGPDQLKIKQYLRDGVEIPGAHLEPARMGLDIKPQKKKENPQ